MPHEFPAELRLEQIRVSARHLELGVKCLAGGCPVSLAIRAHLDGLGLPWWDDDKFMWSWRVLVRHASARLYRPGEPVEYIGGTPAAVQRFVFAFDLKDNLKGCSRQFIKKRMDAIRPFTIEKVTFIRKEISDEKTD